MNSNSLVHDCAFVMAQEIVRVFSRLLRDEERRDAFEEAYKVISAGIDAYERKSARRLSRLEPRRN
jgi:hypothetical protein